MTIARCNFFLQHTSVSDFLQESAPRPNCSEQKSARKIIQGGSDPPTKPGRDHHHQRSLPDPGFSTPLLPPEDLVGNSRLGKSLSQFWIQIQSFKIYWICQKENWLLEFTVTVTVRQPSSVVRFVAQFWVRDKCETNMREICRSLAKLNKFVASLELNSFRRTKFYWCYWSMIFHQCNDDDGDDDHYIFRAKSKPKIFIVTWLASRTNSRFD